MQQNEFIRVYLWRNKFNFVDFLPRDKLLFDLFVQPKDFSHCFVIDQIR